MKKVFVLYAGVGSGHQKSAEAVYNYLKEFKSDLEVKIIDVLEKAGLLFKFGYARAYKLLVEYVPFLWGFIFWLTYIPILRLLSQKLALIINQLNTLKVRRLLIRENPDFIISTHFLSSEIASLLKKEKMINSQLFSIITDLGVHPFWISSCTDIYIVATEETKKMLISFGVNEEKIRIWGIPIDKKFLMDFDKEALSKKFNLDKQKFTVLIVTGSFGIGPIEKIVDLLYKDIQILVVCGKNKRLYQRLKNRQYPEVLIFGFIENIQELMAVSNLVITKPGGLSIAEILSINLFPIFISPIPGQEKENIRILAKYNIGIYLKDVKIIKEVVLKFRDYPQELEKMKENISKIKKSFVLEEIKNALCAGSFRTSG